MHNPVTCSHLGCSEGKSRMRGRLGEEEGGLGALAIRLQKIVNEDNRGNRYERKKEKKMKGVDRGRPSTL